MQERRSVDVILSQCYSGICDLCGVYQRERRRKDRNHQENIIGKQKVLQRNLFSVRTMDNGPRTQAHEGRKEKAVSRHRVSPLRGHPHRRRLRHGNAAIDIARSVGLGLSADPLQPVIFSEVSRGVAPDRRTLAYHLLVGQL